MSFLSPVRVWMALILGLPCLFSFIAPEKPTQSVQPRLTGEWVFVEDRSTGRPDASRRPNMGKRFVVREEPDAVVFDWSDAAHATVYRYKRDGSEEEVKSETSVTRHHGGWKDGRFVIETRVEVLGPDDKPLTTVSKNVLTLEKNELIVEFAITEPVQVKSTCLYRRAAAEGTALPPPFPATLASIAWLSGNWNGTLGSASIEERFGPAGGGAMLATARTIANGKMVAFEFLRIVERDGGLVYVAQPNGGPPTEFVLVSATTNKIVFENAQHDFPQRIAYALQGDRLEAEISDIQGGRAQKFSFQREAAR